MQICSRTSGSKSIRMWACSPVTTPRAPLASPEVMIGGVADAGQVVQGVLRTVLSVADGDGGLDVVGGPAVGRVADAGVE